MSMMRSDYIHAAMHKALAEVDRQLASGELDQSGRFWTDEELAQMLAAQEAKKAVADSKAPAA
ncbi:hypothetical protein ACOBR2_09195 [Telmatobacter bradus]|uniref:hypothetical protein n=1 Tax=Telmatobacter bradus TaxID=474953 RepID=UPI003B436E21